MTYPYNSFSLAIPIVLWSHFPMKCSPGYKLNKATDMGRFLKWFVHEWENQHHRRLEFFILCDTRWMPLIKPETPKATSWFRALKRPPQFGSRVVKSPLLLNASSASEDSCPNPCLLWEWVPCRHSIQSCLQLGVTEVYGPALLACPVPPSCWSSFRGKRWLGHFYSTCFCCCFF